MHDRRKHRVDFSIQNPGRRISTTCWSQFPGKMAFAHSARLSLLALAWLGLLGSSVAQDSNRDQFTYKNSASTSPNNQYPPNQWRKVRCGDLEECVGWPEKFLAAPDWKLDSNDCEWCPATSPNSCGTHHQSPINLERNRAVNESKYHNQCIDVHRMNFYDSSCTFDELKRLEAFTIERYALSIKQPIEISNGEYRNACSNNGKHYFGRLDYSKGFSDWWWLSNTDIHVSLRAASGVLDLLQREAALTLTFAFPLSSTGSF